ncbi:reverse transcriptase domain-containing protein [Tanacetum coccineum]|uniref:Reverse transcriptase domain-containing protein n=1 Tax=Tanacetum coccineum TaxID=301880 RepID=A0ABQ5CKM4_9ASTR
MAPDRIAATSKEVEELKKARILRETRYQMWVANTVMVKKTYGPWRMCVDFTNINKACPKDCYHQIQMAKEDEHKTAFHARHGVYCYRKMPFGLKNAGAIYQRYDGKHPRNLRKVTEDKYETQPEEVLFRDGRRPIPEARGVKARLSRKKDFTWTREADKVIEEMKRYIEKFPTLVAPKARENLIVYLAASKECISVVLMAKRGKDQRPIYFVSRVLQGAELNYPIMEKLVVAQIHVARSLKKYFQAHNITVLTNKHIRLLLSKPEKLGRVARWAIELGEHEIEFKPRNAVKAQILASFLAETKKEDKEKDFQEQQLEGQNTR